MSMEGNHFQQGKQSQLPGTSRQAEEAFLERTLTVIRTNLENYGEQVSRMREEIDEMLDHFHDDNPELINLLENSMTLHDQMKRALERNEKAQNKPYFGRIDFYDEQLEREESIYIGKGGISKDSTHQAVIDWRAPVANAYYENGLGKCSYTAPGNREIPIDLKLKRTYEIEGGKLLDYYDSEVVANDELLTKYLAKNKQAVLGEIIATIQKEQNDIIRKSPYHNIIVQGVAGSGKTTVAMHRISFILYNYQERFKPDDFYIVGSNRILLNYITGVLPDLDVYGIRQMTMEQLFVRLLYEDWDEKKYGIRSGIRSGNADSVKGTSGWFQNLKEYCDELEWSSILRESVYLNPKQFVEGLRDGKNGVYDTTEGKPANPHDLIRLVDGEAVERYILQNPKVSMQSKINMLNDRLIIKIREEFLGKGVKYTEAERKAILKAYRGRYGGKVWKGSIYQLYRDFLKLQADRGKAVDIPDREFDVYDLAALAYLYKRIKETEVISEAHHIVIDEAQDFGMMAYSVLHFCIEACTYTIMGDVSQNIHFGYGLNDWEELRRLLLRDEMDSFGILKKSYRNTVEISDFATNILHHGRFSSYPVEPIIRHGDPVRVERCGEQELFRKAAEVCRQWQEKGFDTIAVVCRSRRSADLAAEALGKYIEVMENDLEKAVFGNGIMVLPVEYTKGLEFDTVLILDPTREDYPVDDGHAKLLYVAATRALHELCVLHTETLTGLIADPVPEGHRILGGGEDEGAFGRGMKEDAAEASRERSLEDQVAESDRKAKGQIPAPGRKGNLKSHAVESDRKAKEQTADSDEKGNLKDQAAESDRKAKGQIQAPDGKGNLKGHAAEPDRKAKGQIPAPGRKGNLKSHAVESDRKAKEQITASGREGKLKRQMLEFDRKGQEKTPGRKENQKGRADDSERERNQKDWLAENTGVNSPGDHKGSAGMGKNISESEMNDQVSRQKQNDGHRADQIGQKRNRHPSTNAEVTDRFGQQGKADYRTQENSKTTAQSAGIQRPRAVLASSAAGGAKQPTSSLTSLYSATPVPSRLTSPPAGSGKSPQSSAPQTARLTFGDIPPTEKLRPMGHSKIDLSIRWVTKQPDGLYLQSRYGTLRLSPVGSSIIRVTFARNAQPDPRVHPGITVDRTEKFWMYRDYGNTVELTTDELLLQTDKSTGAIRYFWLEEETGEKTLLLQERKRECRQLEPASGGCFQTWLFLDYAKDERLYALSPEGSAGIPLKGAARYLSHSDGKVLPLLLSDRGYGILTAASSTVFGCDIPTYGSYLHCDCERQLDFYFIAGRKKDTLLNAYAYLCGKM